MMENEVHLINALCCVKTHQHTVATVMRFPGSMVLAEHAILASSCELVLSSYGLISPKSTDYWSISFMVILLQTKNRLYRPFLLQTQTSG